MLKAVRDSIYCFSFNIDGEIKERYPHSTELGEKDIRKGSQYELNLF